MSKTILQLDKQELFEVLCEVLPSIAPPQSERAWSVKECAEYLTISEQKVRQMVDADQIPHFRAGDRVLFHPHEIRQWPGTQKQVEKQVIFKHKTNQ